MATDIEADDWKPALFMDGNAVEEFVPCQQGKRDENIVDITNPGNIFASR